LRQIGTLPKGIDPKVFTDYLLTLGMKARVDEQPEGWLFWIYNEDHTARAREELQNYVARPDDPRFQTAAETATAIRRREDELNKRFRKNYREVSDLWAYPDLRRRPLTSTLVAVCVAVFLLEHSSAGFSVQKTLSFTPLRVTLEGEIKDSGLAPILHGEVWRLVTPIFMHGGIIHIGFNMLCLIAFGTQIELRRGTLRLFLLVLIAAIVSNFGQYLWMLHLDEGIVRAGTGDDHASQ
jgi:GlpG protein